MSERTVLAHVHPMTGVSFHVRGAPVPQGSVRAFVAGGRARVATKTPDLMAWRTAIATAAASAMGDEPVITRPVTVLATFRVRRPASAPKRVTVPATRPDLDKLVRALLDGMTGVILSDDALVVRIDAEKVYADDVYPMGVSVEVLPR